MALIILGMRYAWKSVIHPLGCRKDDEEAEKYFVAVGDDACVSFVGSTGIC
jgi:hypothetical protein